MFDNDFETKEEFRKTHWKVSYVNVRSLRSKKSQISNDNYLMDADIFGLGETHLAKEELIDFENFTGHFASSGKGKGTAAFSKVPLCNNPQTIVEENYSMIMMKTESFTVVFVYLSKDYDELGLFNYLDNWITFEQPTAVIGDVNWDYSQDTKMKDLMRQREFFQLIEKPTFDRGTLIDHIYINKPLREKKSSTEQVSAYYTDHDIISLFIPKE